MPVYLVRCVEFKRSLVSAIFWANSAPAALLREAGGAAKKPLSSKIMYVVYVGVLLYWSIGLY